MNRDEVAQETLHILDRDGETLDFDTTEDDISYLIALAKRKSPISACIVKDWVWIDLDIAEEHRDLVPFQDVPPCLIYARHCLGDERGRFRVGDWVRTSPLKKFHKPCFFETGNTLYILIGPGTKKTASPSAAAYLDKIDSVWAEKVLEEATKKQ